jgi:hypothetical protein
MTFYVTVRQVVSTERQTRPDMYEVHFTHKKYRHKIYVDERGREHEYHDRHSEWPRICLINISTLLETIL